MEFHAVDQLVRSRYAYSQQRSGLPNVYINIIYSNNNQGNNTTHINPSSGPTLTQVFIGVGVVAVVGLAVYVIGPAAILSGIKGFFSWLGGSSASTAAVVVV